MTYAPRSRSARATGTYANIGLETEVLSASPERLISLLFRGALTAIAQARHHMHNGNIQERGKALSKAIDIVDSGLKAGVDTERGGEVARLLISSYELIIRDLMLANLRSDEAKLDTAEKMLTDLAGAWHTAVDPQFGDPPPSH
ncbi:flagellar export chaperone FliS [Castellaniella daejeonensis]|jgi:flagellar protein FliS|uniref:Flagellar secretion chaperone FliS n=1 Tax=Castellaniella daejeonensis TaxID=659013 RepID=A0ABN0THE4_9BURK|nr:flagellar export chaperone FliS [Castellaniella sp.]HET8702828.1 flagellar export chaperone FliS [Castellaniella sp.]